MLEHVEDGPQGWISKAWPQTGTVRFLGPLKMLQHHSRFKIFRSNMVIHWFNMHIAGPLRMLIAWNMPRMTWHQRCLNCPRTCSPSSSRHSHLHAAGGSSKKIWCFLQNCKASIQPIGVDNISPNCVTRIEQTSYRSIQDEIGRSESEYAFFRSKRDTCAWSCLHCRCTSQLHNWLAIHIG